jgi:hypothetical protein
MVPIWQIKSDAILMLAANCTFGPVIIAVEHDHSTERFFRAKRTFCEHDT